MPEFQDIIEVQEPIPLFLWWQWVLIGLGSIILIAVLIVLLKKNKKVRAAKSLSDLERALKQIDLIDPNRQTSNQTAVHLSLIVRQYLQNRLDDPALFETDEEFHARSQDLENLPKDAADKLRNYLDQVSRIKYSPDQNDANIVLTLLDNARSLLPSLDRNLQTATP